MNKIQINNYLQKFKTIESAKEAYLVLRAQAVSIVKKVLDSERDLFKDLVYDSTHYKKYQFIDGKEVVNEADKFEDNLLEIARCQINCGPCFRGVDFFKMYFMINLKEYRKGSDKFIYIVYYPVSYIGGEEECGELKELSNITQEDTKWLRGSEYIFFRYIPLLELFTKENEAKKMLSKMTARKYGTMSECEIVDAETGKVVQRV